jgi:general stress protein CsbA
MKNYHITLLNAAILIGIGFSGYFAAAPDHRSMTAFIAPAAGILLLAMFPAVKKQNKTITHVVVVLTLLITVSFFITGFMRGNSLIIIMAVVSLIALILYIMDFIRRKKERENKQTL